MIVEVRFEKVLTVDRFVFRCSCIFLAAICFWLFPVKSRELASGGGISLSYPPPQVLLRIIGILWWLCRIVRSVGSG